MRALMKKKAEPGLWLEQAPTPTIGPDELLIKVSKTAICGTDLHIYNWDSWSQKHVAPPLIIGHEFVGTVAGIGSAVQGFSYGERVSGEGHITCSHCRNCRAGKRHLCRNTLGLGVQRQGAFAEYVALPASNVFKVPEQIPDEVASIFDPLGNAVHTTLSFDLVGEDVLITGAGPIGMMATAIAKHVGARHVVVVDIKKERLQMAQALGASRVVNPLQDDLATVQKELGMREGFDVGLEMSGNASAFASMLQAMNYGGKIAVLGIFPEPITLDWHEVIFKSLTIKGIYGREMFETWYKMTAMLQSGLNILPVITHRLPAGDFAQGFSLLQEGKAAKVVLEW